MCVLYYVINVYLHTHTLCSYNITIETDTMSQEKYLYYTAENFNCLNTVGII